jgi:hypothetical protein
MAKGSRVSQVLLIKPSGPAETPKRVQVLPADSGDYLRIRIRIPFTSTMIGVAL